MRTTRPLGRDYHVATAGPARPGPLDELRPYVAEKRGAGWSWSQIAKAIGRPAAGLQARFGKEFP